MIDVAVGLVVGTVAGALFFGGLRWTLSRMATAKHVVLLTVSSFMVRSAVVVGLLVLVADGRPARLLGALVGMLAVRTVLVSRARAGLDSAKETSWI